MSAKVLLVTGASRGGIGRACALLAAEKGWAVGVNYREDAKAADAVVETLAKAAGRSVALKGDIAVEADVIGMFDATTKALGPIAGVIANAGIVAPAAKLVDRSAERMRRIFQVNLLGAYLTARQTISSRSILPRRRRTWTFAAQPRRAPRLAEPRCRLCRVQGRGRHGDLRASQGTRPGAC